MFSPHFQPAAATPSLGDGFFDVVEPARFPRAVLRFRNQAWAERVGLGELTDDEWIGRFARFEPIPGSLPAPLALRYHGHQFQVYNAGLGDGRGFLYTQLREPSQRGSMPRGFPAHHRLRSNIVALRRGHPTWFSFSAVMNRYFTRFD